MKRLIKPELQHYLGSFLLQTAMMAAMTLIPFFCFQHLEGKERSAALAYGVQTLSLGVTCFLSAPLVSKWKNGLLGCLIGSFGFGAFYFCASFTTSLIPFCVLTGIAMCFFALAWPALQSWLGAQPDEQRRTKSFSYFNVAIGLGLIAGPLVEGPLYQMNFRAAFFAVCLLSIAAAVLLFTLPHEKQYFSSSVASPAEAPVRPASDASRASELFLYCGWLTNMLGWGITGAIRTVYAGRVNELVYRGQLVLLSAATPWHTFTARGTPAASLYSELQAMYSLGYFAAIVALGCTTRWQQRISLVICFEACLGATTWILGNSRSLLLMLMCHSIVGAVTAFGYLGSQCYSAANPSFKHRRIAVNEGLAQSAGFVIPLLFAQFGIWYGLSWPFKHAYLLLGGFALLQLFSLRFARSQLNRRPFDAQNVIGVQS